MKVKIMIPKEGKRVNLKLAILMIFVGIVLLSGGISNAKKPIQYDAVVQGTGDPAIDIPAVQAAVDTGGKILLRGTFDFGEPDFTGIDPLDRSTWPVWGGYPQFRPHSFLGVVIMKSVDIIGENAIISGGYIPFFIYNVALDADVKISNLTLKLPTLHGIEVVYCGTVTIENVTINGVKSCYAAKGRFRSRPSDREGFVMTPRSLCDPDPNLPPTTCVEVPVPYRLANKLTIKNCNFDLVGDTGMAEYTYNDLDTRAYGILVAYGVGTEEKPIDLLIDSNIVSNTSLYGILVSDIAGIVTIQNNTCLPGNKVRHSDNAGAGILAGQHQPIFGGEDHLAEWATYIINGNTINLVPATLTDNSPLPDGQLTSGIFLFGTVGSTLRKNKLTSSASNAQLLQVIASNDAYIRENKMSGTGIHAGISLWLNSSGNVFEENNLAVLDSGLLTYYFDGRAANNTVRGFSGGTSRVVDLPDYEPQITYLFFDISYPSQWEGIYWIPVDAITEQTYGPWNAGYYNSELTKPNLFDREIEVSVIDSILWASSSWVLATLKIIHPVKIDASQNPIVLEDGKQNFITGCEPMSGSPKPGPILSTRKIYIPSEQEIMDNLPE